MVQHAVRGVSRHAGRGKARVMRVVVVGASGNLGTSVLRSLSMEPRVESVLGVARRLPNLKVEKVEWAAADVVTDDLETVFRGADAVVHLAWLIQPSRDPVTLWRVNVEGSLRVFEATARAGAGASAGSARSATMRQTIGNTMPGRRIAIPSHSPSLRPARPAGH